MIDYNKLMTKLMINLRSLFSCHKL